MKLDEVRRDEQNWDEIVCGKMRCAENDAAIRQNKHLHEGAEVQLIVI
jgi:hypothetical protein